MKPIAFSSLAILFYSVTVTHGNPRIAKDTIHVVIQEQSLPSKEAYKLSLSKPERSVLHPDIKVIKVATNLDKTGNEVQSTHIWIPSKTDIYKAEADLYIDTQNLATVQVVWDETKREHVAVRGLVGGKKVENGTVQNNGQPGNKTDYIDKGIKLTPSHSIQSNQPNLVELLVVCDYELSRIFRHDQQRLLDYFTVYFYDVNMQYKSLHSSQVSFQINGIVAIDSPNDQPFVEETRDSEGRASMNGILPKFGDWVWAKRHDFPHFDLAVILTATQLTWYGGLAYMNVACSSDGWSVSVWADGGTWDSTGLAGHEIGHNLGAPHDDDEDCVNRGFESNSKSWAFSTCSDYKIAQFMNSEQASCLKTTEQPIPAAPKDFYGVMPPDMNEQCKQRLNNREASISEEDTANCESMKCWVPNQNGGGWLIYWRTPVENTPCLGGGRCFRARCRKPGNLLMNVGSGECVQDPAKFKGSHWTELTQCPDPREAATPLDKFLVEDVGANGKYLMTPYSSEDNSENGEKCIHTGSENRDWVWTEKCDTGNPWQGWHFHYVDDSWEFMLHHKMSGRCAKKEGRYILVEDCDENEASMRWKLI